MKSIHSSVLHLTSVSLIRDKKTILKDISWKISRGEHWALIGANGSGKTMLLKVITGYEWPTSGAVEVLGKRYGEVDLREMRKQIGWVSSDLQARMQQNSSAEEVVLSGYFASIGFDDRLLQSPKLLKPLKGKAIELMEFMGVRQLTDQFFSLLSFGEQKRVLIARSLMHEPKLLILDEPCTGLDIKAREEFLPFIEQLGRKNGGPTIIMTTHHIEEIVPVFSHVIALKKGQVVVSGNKENVLREENIENIFDIQTNLIHRGERYWWQGGVK